MMMMMIKMMIVMMMMMVPVSSVMVLSLTIHGIRRTCLIVLSDSKNICKLMMMVMMMMMEVIMMMMMMIPLAVKREAVENEGARYCCTDLPR